jgi:mono/diheme cytochrome c family protein
MQIRSLIADSDVRCQAPAGFLAARWLSRAVGVLFSVWGLHAAVASDEISYRRQVQPLLARSCFACHGPDAQQRQADLRLDQESSAKEAAIVGGQPEASSLIERIFSTDADSVMPPPETGHPLTAAEKELLRRWVAQGANYESHWAFEPILRPSVPAIDDDGLDHPIDRFVIDQHQAVGLQLSPPAEPHQLLRRVYFDLVGLPPSSEDAREFLAAPTPDRYGNLIERLLRSPHYGEHMAVTWLDLARYADTNGYQNDFYRSQWPWRDWVIRAFNRHQPYDEFLVEQLAGDMLPAPTTDQLIATGFNRNNRSVTEGGSIEEEWRIENCVDRVETTAATFLGLTMGCARCHDHKYDPITQDDFFRFFAFFNNIDELGVYIETRGNTGPQVKVPTAEQLEALATVESQLAELRAELEADAAGQTWEGLWRQWNDSLGDASGIAPRPIFQSLAAAATSAGDGAAVTPAGDGAAESRPVGASPVGAATVFSGQPAAGGLGAVWDQVERDSAFSWSVWLNGSARGALFSKMDEANGYRGFDGIVLEDGKLKVHLIHQWNSNALAVVAKAALEADAWHLLTVTYDGSSQATGLRLYLDGHPMAVDVEVDTLRDTIRNDAPAFLGQRRQTLFLNGRLAEFAWFDSALSPTEVIAWQRQSVARAFQNILGKSPTAIVADESSGGTGHSDRDPIAAPVLRRYLTQQSVAERRGRIRALEAERERLLATQQTCMIMRDRPAYRPTHPLRRGQYDQPDTSRELWPAIPAVLPPLAEDQPANRLGLARWMIDPRNPLVARVAVNRIWTQFFGRGLVDSPDNFGIQGTPPSHPELLDWLAAELRDSGWNVQHLQRLILTSRTYQQASAHDLERAERDPNNQWLWRGPRVRLSAEQLRDQALAVAGLLDPQVGGPSVFPYQPAGLWEELAGGANDGPYRLSAGTDIYRRGLYTYRKRTVSHPMLATFDAPSWEICYVQRATTNTPLQSLALLNGPTYVEAARHLADRLLRAQPRLGQLATDLSPSEFDSEILQLLDAAYQKMLFRRPSESEQQRLAASFRAYLEHYRQHPEDAEAILTVGQSAATSSARNASRAEDVSSPAWERATWAALTITTSVLMNTDEFLTKE